MDLSELKKLSVTELKAQLSSLGVKVTRKILAWYD